MGPVTSESAETHALKSQPMALEVPVVATGARPGDKSEKRELFTETTQTVLVFEHGAVLPLSAAVAIGQLLFLTNKNSGREIVAQVVRKKDFRPTACYVELEFTEAAPGYWGVEFPAANVAANQVALKGGIPEEFEEAETTEERVGQGQHAPADVAEVTRLRQEVEALKAQLKSVAPGAEVAKPAPVIDEAILGEVKPDEMKLAEAQPEESKPVEEKPIKIGTQYAKPEVNDKVEEAKPVEVKIEVMRPDEPGPEAVSEVKATPAAAVKLELMSPHEPTPEVAAPEVAIQEAARQEGATAWPAVSQELEQSASYPIRMQLPKATEESNRTSEFAADDAAAEHLLPKPSLDFAQYPGSAEPSPKLYSRSARKGLAGPIGVLVFIVLLLTAAGILAYRMEWLSGSSKKESSASAFPKEGGSEAVTSGAVEEPSSGEEGLGESIATHSNATAPLAHGSQGGHASTEPVRKAVERPAGKSAKRTPDEREHTASVAPPVNPANDVIVPPKLVKAIRSLSPPEALRNYVSGNVKLDALVDETGHVVSATATAGPSALYEKAIETVKQYEYKPATKNGKPVPAHVKVTIQFWYEP